MKKNGRVYNFDKLEQISGILGMNLVYQNGSYIDLNSSDEPGDRDQYFDWHLVKILDTLTIDKVRNVLCNI